MYVQPKTTPPPPEKKSLILLKKTNFRGDYVNNVMDFPRFVLQSNLLPTELNLQVICLDLL